MNNPYEQPLSTTILLSTTRNHQLPWPPWPRPLSKWRAKFSILPSLITAGEADAMKSLLRAAPDDFDEDIDGVDKLLATTRELVKSMVWMCSMDFNGAFFIVK